MYTLPRALRAELKTPFGPVFSTAEAVAELKGRPVIAVGDVCAREFLRAGVTPHVIVADWVTQRGAVASGGGATDPLLAFRDRAAKGEGARRIPAGNPAATITRALWDAVRDAIESPEPVLVDVEGEEDLATLPALVLAPEGSVVAYGQPNEGVVLVPVDEAVRARAQDLLKRMEVTES